MKRVIACALLAAAVVPGVALDATLYSLQDIDPLARCMDGTFGAFYLQPNTTAEGGKKFVIHLEGGGECTTEDACKGKLDSALGSSKGYAKTLRGLPFLMDADAGRNPDFHDASHAYVKYCSQDLHTGQHTEPNAWGVIFAGHHVVNATFRALLKNHGLSAAASVILSGDSAGGIGVWPHVDQLSQLLAPYGTRVVAVPIAGFYFDANVPYRGVNHTSSGLANFSSEGLAEAYSLWGSFVNPVCELTLGPVNKASECLLANNSFPFVSSESFAVEAQTDMVVLTAHDWMPGPPDLCNAPQQQYLSEWSGWMQAALQPLLEPANERHGVFNPACFIHTAFNSSAPLIDGVSYITALGNWFFKRPGPYKLKDTCGILCNPSCVSPCPK
ncbi:Pectin acetylesterase 3 [Diplonema papillatum]|nr:Pectin acetylesterase 3 [Diplonema papillatum]